MEQLIEGEEFTVGILDDEALPTIRIVPPGEYYDYHAKYVSDDTQYICPGLHGQAETDMRALALEAFRTAACSGWGRVDLMRDRDGQNYLLEVNTTPGMTSHSLVPKARARRSASISTTLVWRILETSLSRGARESGGSHDLATRKRNRRKPERSGDGVLARLAQADRAGGLQSVLGIAGMLVGIGIMLWGLALAFDRPIGQVEVGGRFQRVAPVQIEEVVAPFRGAGSSPSISTPLRAALESIPWVDRARVERRWPNGVRVVHHRACRSRALGRGRPDEYARRAVPRRTRGTFRRSCRSSSGRRAPRRRSHSCT